jgi:hypothetical protein
MPDGQCHGSVDPQGKGSESRKMRKDGIVYVDLCERGGGMRLQTGPVVGARDRIVTDEQNLQGLSIGEDAPYASARASSRAVSE